MPQWKDMPGAKYVAPVWPSITLRWVAIVGLALAVGLWIWVANRAFSEMHVADFPDGHPGQVAVSMCGGISEQVGHDPVPDTRYLGIWDWSFRGESDTIVVVYTEQDGTPFGRVVGWNCGEGDQWS